MLTIRQFTFNPIRENTYVIFDEKGACAIIDPGCYFDFERKELTDFVDKNNLLPKCLLNTHCHLDHVFGNKFIAETYGLVLQIHSGEKQMLDYAPLSGEQWGLPFDNYTGPLQFFKQNDEVMIGDDALKILFTPGHSPASVSFYNAGQQFVIAGDALFRDSIGRTDLPGGDFDTLIASIRSQLFTLPPDTVVYAGHGPQTTIGHELRHNPFFG